MSPLCPCSNQGTSESDEILVELPRKLWQSITFVFVGVCVLCVCVCSVCLCWRRLPMLNYWRQALGIIGFTQDTCYHKSKKTFVLYRKESILIYLCQLIKACNPTHATWSICSCEFATLHSTQLWPDHNFLFQGATTQNQFTIRSHEASWCGLFSFGCMPLVKRQPLFFQTSNLQ